MRICFLPEARPVPEPGLANYVFELARNFENRITDINHADIVNVHDVYPSPRVDVATCYGWYFKEDFGDAYYDNNNAIFGNMHRAKEVIVTSKWLQSKLEEYKINAHCVPFGVSDRPSKKGGEYVLYPYRWGEARTPRDVVELAKLFPDIEFKINCDKPKDYAAPSNVSFLGHCIMYPKLIKLYSNASAIINTWNNDATGEGVLEALAFGKPVLGKKGGANSDILNKDIGYLYEDIDDMKIGLEKLLNSDLYDNCIKESKKYNWKNIAKQVDKVFQQVWRVPVSVVVLTYNNHRTIQRALESCGNGPEVVMCDASKNHQAYKPRRKRFIYLQTGNESIGDNRNKAVEETTQRFVTFCDADDYMLDGKVPQLCNWFKKMPDDVGLIFGNGFYGDSTFKEVIKNIRNIDLEHYGNITAEQLLKGNFVPSGAIMFRREIFDKLGGFDPKLSYAEDYDYYLRLLDAGYKIIYIDALVYVYDSLRNETSISKTYNKRHETLKYVLGKAKERVPNRKIVNSDVGVI